MSLYDSMKLWGAKILKSAGTTGIILKGLLVTGGFKNMER